MSPERSDESESTRPAVRRCLTFVSGSERFAVDTMVVREIVGTLPITRVPRLSSEVIGVSNLRGRVLPVFAFRRLVGLPDDAQQAPGCTVVIDVGQANVGIVVDRVVGVMQMAGAVTKEVPNVDLQVDRRFLQGMCVFDDAPHLLIELDQLLASTGLIACE